MTDKKTIWHLPTEPVQERFIIAIIDEKLYPFFGVYYLDEGSYLTKAQDWSDVEKWCYLDDLLELSNKIERLGKVLEDIDNITKSSTDSLAMQILKIRATITGLKITEIMEETNNAE